jgi:transglutaminase-like putative cysteine protease
MSLQNQNPKNEKTRAVQSQNADAAFSTSRQSKPKAQKQEERKTPTMLQWVGPPATHLALQRYNTYDGIEWTDSSDDSGPAPRLRGAMIRKEIDQRVWYFRPEPASPLLGPARGDAIKVINLRSPRIAAPAMASGVHIADVDRDDFFGITGDGSLHMPDRSSVPSLTVIRLVTFEIDGDQLRASGELAPRSPPPNETETTSSGIVSPGDHTPGMVSAGQLARQWTADATTDWQRVKRVIERLREDFVFDRSTSSVSEDPLADFLKNRRGGDHLFATAATVMLQQLGFDSRLTTGFYAPRRTSRWATSQVDVLAEDAHVWCEVKAAEGVWVPLEPTPGYEEPQLYRTLIRRFASAVWVTLPYGLGFFVAIGILWYSRRVWGEWMCRAIWRLSKPIDERRRVALLVRLLDWRGRLAGTRRGAGVTPRRWVEQAAMVAEGIQGDTKLAGLQVAASRFFDVADAAFYGPTAAMPRSWVIDADRVASGLTVRALMKSKRLKMVTR